VLGDILPSHAVQVTSTYNFTKQIILLKTNIYPQLGMTQRRDHWLRLIGGLRELWLGVLLSSNGGMESAPRRELMVPRPRTSSSFISCLVELFDSRDRLVYQKTSTISHHS
jgi:hypothetical protein